MAVSNTDNKEETVSDECLKEIAKEKIIDSIICFEAMLYIANKIFVAPPEELAIRANWATNLLRTASKKMMGAFKAYESVHDSLSKRPQK